MQISPCTRVKSLDCRGYTQHGQMLRGVYPEPRIEILHFVQDDREGLSMTRSIQNRIQGKGTNG